MKNQVKTASEVKNSNRTRTLAHETRKNKQWLSMLFIAALVLSATFTSCDKDDEDGGTIDKITATVEGGAKYNGVISKVKLGLDIDDEIVVIATGDWSNGGFTIELPKTVDAKYLEPFSGNVKVSGPIVAGFDEDDEFVTIFVCGKKENGPPLPYPDVNYYYRAYYIYSDSDLNVSDEFSLKKGWNFKHVATGAFVIVDGGYVFLDEQSTFSNNVSGMKWYSDEDFPY